MRRLSDGVRIVILWAWGTWLALHPCRAEEAPGQEAPTREALFQGLKTVIDQGADLYNLQGDIAGCYRLYQGALLTLKPTLAAYPDLLKEVEEALKKADSQPRVVDRAFTLRHVLGQVRENFRGEKIPSKKEVSQKKEAIPDNKAGARLTGTVRLAGKTGTTGYITLIGPNNRTFSTFIHDNGTFQFRTPVPFGDYQITIETGHKENAPAPKEPFPARYQAAESSGLTVRLDQNAQELQLDLKP